MGGQPLPLGLCSGTYDGHAAAQVRVVCEQFEEQDRKLRDLLWRAWVVPRSGCSSESRDLSLRDMYRRVCFHDECSRMSQRLAQAMQAQEEILMTCPEPYRPPALRRGASEAGLRTPPSRASKGKQSRGRGGGGA